MSDIKPTPRTDELLTWIQRDAPYRAPEIFVKTQEGYINRLVDLARQLERELAAVLGECCTKPETCQENCIIRWKHEAMELRQLLRRVQVEMSEGGRRGRAMDLMPADTIKLLDAALKS